MVKKNSEGLLEIFFMCNPLYTVHTNRKHLPNIFIFFFHMIFWGSAKPRFSWYKVASRSYLAATPKIRLPGAPTLDT